MKNFTEIENIANSPEHQNASGVINQYKDIIRDQDYKLQSLQISAKRSEEEIENLKKQLTDVQQTNAQLFDQNILLKAQLAAATNGHNSSATQNSHPSNNNNNLVSSATEVGFYKSENRRLEEEVNVLNAKLNEALEMTERSLGLTEIGKLRKDQEDLLELLTDQVRIKITKKLTIQNQIYFEFEMKILFWHFIALFYSFLPCIFHRQENKIKKYRHRLIKLGQTVTDDEESEEEIDTK